MRAFIGLGGNVGDTRSAFAAAAAELRTIGTLVRASSLYASTPRDFYGQPEFINAAVELDTDVDAPTLLASLKRLELALGRDPHGMRFGPRVIDLDILSLDGQCVEDTQLPLIIPHPRLHERRFALEPLAELAPGMRPWRGCADVRRDVTVADLLATVSDQEMHRLEGPAWADARVRD